MNKDARMTLTKISRKTGIAIDTIKYRINEMKRKEIFNYAIIINPLKMGYPIFNALYLELIHFTKKEEKSLSKYIESHPYLVYAGKLSGKYDFVVGIISKDMNQFDQIANEFKTKFEHIIKNVDMMLVMKEYKYDYLLDLIE